MTSRLFLCAIVLSALVSHEARGEPTPYTFVGCVQVAASARPLPSAEVLLFVDSSVHAFNESFLGERTGRTLTDEAGCFTVSGDLGEFDSPRPRPVSVTLIVMAAGFRAQRFSLPCPGPVVSESGDRRIEVRLPPVGLR